MKVNHAVREAVERLYSKLQIINPQDLPVSEYNKIYITKYLENYSFYMSCYFQLLQKAIRKLNKPVSESVFIDYGGGCGILSFLAKESGFKTVVYNDINKASVADTKTFSKSLGIEIDQYICGDAGEFVSEINKLKIKPDLICSFDVIEHIYDLESWIKTIVNIDTGFSLLCMTSANPLNPFIVARLKKLHKISEFQGTEKNIRLNNKFLNTSSLEERTKIIRNKYPELKENAINMLSEKSRGLRIDDIEILVTCYIETGNITYKISHPTNTCDPYTGNWTEKLIDLKQLKLFIRNQNLKVDLSNSFYSYSKNKVLNIPKFILNQLIRISGPGNLFFSPSFTLEIQKN
jgi:hypothetical protein